MFIFRPDTLDSYIFYKVVHQNEYRLIDNLNNNIIIDIGAHIGSFSIAAMNRNTNNIYAYEAHPDNYKIAKMNISLISNNPHIFNFAVVGNNSGKQIGYQDLSFNTGQHKVTRIINDNKYIDTISFDKIVFKIIDSHNKKIDILKIDCEGFEYQILYTSSVLYSINNIVGEYHENIPKDNLDIPYAYNGKTLIDFLRQCGFLVYHQHIKDAGLFFAVRDFNNYPFLINKELFQ